MQPNVARKQSDAGHCPYRLLLSVGLPFLLLLAFLARQIINFDNIGWSHGFSHPLTGWDHLLTMLAVGVWAAQLRGQAVWMLPLAFVGVMSIGGLAGAVGISIPSVEGIILLSCAVFSVLITRKIRFSAKINVLIVAFFAFFHGFAHGQEISTSASLISYTLGFMLATLLLHGAGFLVAKLVVLAVSCLLAALFSGAALAKHASATERNNAVSTTNAAFDAYRSFGRDDHQAALQRLLQTDNVASENCLEYCGFGSTGMTASGAFDKSHSANRAKLKAVVDYAALIVKTVSVNVLHDWRMFSLLLDEYCALSFRKHYPAINHTPGTHLLSNGVGRTSPPAANHPFYDQSLVSDFRKKIQSAIEDNHLQLSFANDDIGKTPHIASNDYKPFGRFDAIAVVNTHKSDVPGQNSFVSNLISNYPVFSSASAIDLTGTNKIAVARQLFASVWHVSQFNIHPLYRLKARPDIWSLPSADISL